MKQNSRSAAPKITRKVVKFVSLATALSLILAACGGGSGFSASSSSSAGEASGTGNLTVLIGASGPAETESVKAAVASYSKESGTTAAVNNASELTQQLSQGFTSGKPADVFYLSPDVIAGYVKNGSLYAYGDQLSNKGEFIPALTSAFTFDGKLYCAPKDFSTLALVINTQMWEAAGLKDTDIPTTWEQLATVAKKLTTKERVGLSFGPEYQRVGAFMKQAGGALTNEENTAATADSPENLKALTYVQEQMKAGTFKFTSDIGAGWGGEAFGKGLAAMTIEGNWIQGALKADYPDVKYKVVELPAGPAGKGTLQFSNCWGIAAASKNKAAAVKLVEYLTKPETQMTFAKDFGVAPSTKKGASEFKTSFPELAAFIAGADYAGSVPSMLGASDVITEVNSKIEGLATGDPKAILTAAQGDFAAILEAK